jgi:hypothetical protein
MAAVDPTNLGRRVVTRDTNWLDLCQRAWGPEFTAPDHGIYQFSNGARKDSTDKYLTGLYGVEVLDGLMVDDDYPDMRTVLNASESFYVEIAIDSGNRGTATLINNLGDTIQVTNSLGAVVDLLA